MRGRDWELWTDDVVELRTSEQCARRSVAIPWAAAMGGEAG